MINEGRANGRARGDELARGFLGNVRVGRGCARRSTALLAHSLIDGEAAAGAKQGVEPGGSLPVKRSVLMVFLSFS